MAIPLARLSQDLRHGAPSPHREGLRSRSYQEPLFAPIWLQGRDSNPRPLGYEPSALPGCATLR